MLLLLLLVLLQLVRLHAEAVSVVHAAMCIITAM